MQKKQITQLLLLPVLIVCLAGCGNNKKEKINEAVTRLKKNITQQLVSINNKAFIERAYAYGSSDRANLFMLLANYDKANRELLMGRIRGLSNEIIDSWTQILSQKNGDDIDRSEIGRRLPHFDFLFTDSNYNKSSAEKYKQRINEIPTNTLNDWQAAIDPFDKGDDYPRANALLVLVTIESLFNGADLKKEVLQKTLGRLKILQPDSLAKLADTMDCRNRKLFVANIAVEDAFFEKDIFQGAAIEQSLMDKRQKK